MSITITIYDTTLRDGLQAKNFNLSVDDQIKIALKLDELQMDFIEGGWPGAVPAATHFFEKMRSEKLCHAKLMAFGMTMSPKSSSAKVDSGLQALLDCGADGFTIFGKSWDAHVHESLEIPLKRNLELIKDTIQYLRKHTNYLFYDAEHFFDGYKANPQYALETLVAATDGGADVLILCDTNGGTLPHEITQIMREVNAFLSKEYSHEIKLGIHAHNDSDCAVANSLAAMQTGATQVQGTVNGRGERCGNANLVSLIPIISEKLNPTTCSASNNLHNLRRLSVLVDELANLPNNKFQPFVGKYAFAHKGGIHVSAVTKNPALYEHINPPTIGNERHIIASGQSGKSNVLHKAQEFNLPLTKNAEILPEIVNALKDKDELGYHYEVADASLEILMRNLLGFDDSYFTSISRKNVGMQDVDCGLRTEAIVRLLVDSVKKHEVASGNGPINALDRALRKALIPSFPSLKEVQLIGYKVRVLQGEHGTDSKVRVLIDSKNGDSTWTTIGVSTDVIEASWQALIDAYNFKLIKENESNQKN